MLQIRGTLPHIIPRLVFIAPVVVVNGNLWLFKDRDDSCWCELFEVSADADLVCVVSWLLSWYLFGRFSTKMSKKCLVYFIPKSKEKEDKEPIYKITDFFCIGTLFA